MEENATLLMFSRWLHILAAMAAIGGAAFMLVALVPAARSALDEASRAKLHEGIRRRWAKVAHSAIAILLLTGGLNFVLVAMPPKVHPMPYHAIFVVKFLLALVVFFLASALLGRSPGLAKLRAAPGRWLSVMVGCGVLIVLISGYLSVVRAQYGATREVSTRAVDE